MVLRHLIRTAPHLAMESRFAHRPLHTEFMGGHRRRDFVIAFVPDKGSSGASRGFTLVSIVTLMLAMSTYELVNIVASPARCGDLDHRQE